MKNVLITCIPMLLMIAIASVFISNNLGVYAEPTEGSIEVAIKDELAVAPAEVEALVAAPDVDEMLDDENPQADADAVYKVVIQTLDGIMKNEGYDPEIIELQEAKQRVFADETSILIDAPLHATGFGGSFYEGNLLHVLVSTDEMHATLTEALKDLSKEFYVIERVAYDYRSLEIALMEFLESDEVFVEAGIDVKNNQVVVGLTAEDAAAKAGESYSSNGVKVVFEESDAEDWILY